MAERSWADSGSNAIFLLSSERSGSTLLRVMMGRHSRVIAPSELWLLSYADYAMWRRAKPNAIESLREYLALVGKSEQAQALEKDFDGLTSTEAFRRLLDLCPPERYLLDKTPGYANSLATLERTRSFQPFYVWLVRHPLGVIDSHLGVHLKRHSSWTPRDVAWRVVNTVESAWSRGMTRSARAREQKWVTQNTNIAQFLASLPPGQSTTVRFEEFVGAPEASLRQICAAMGLPFEPAMLSNEKPQRMVAGLGDMNFHEHAGVEAQTASRWQRRFSEGVLQPDTVSLMRTLGLPLR